MRRAIVNSDKTSSEKAFLNFPEEKSKNFYGYINAVPKIYDSRLKTFLKPSIAQNA